MWQSNRRNVMTRKYLRIAVVVLLAGSCRSVPQVSSLAITGVTVIDVRDGSRIANATIVVSDGRITAIGAAAGTAVPSSARLMDFQGKYVIPGLWDVHTHIQNERELNVFFPL